MTPRIALALLATGLLGACPTTDALEREVVFADALPHVGADVGVDGQTSPAPPLRPVQFFVGQNTTDLTTFRDEVLVADPSFPRPDGVTLYTNIDPGTCSGTTDGACTIGGTTTDFERTLAEYPDASLAVGLYLSDSYAGCSNRPLRAILGRDDADLRDGAGQAFRQELDDLIGYLDATGRDVYLRVGYEFDGPWNCYDQELYIDAFREVHARIDALGADRVQTVWQSATYPLDGPAGMGYDVSAPSHFVDWYPGDDVVDWVAISAFAWDPLHLSDQWACATPDSVPSELYVRAARFARERGKPLMIAESTPAGFRTLGPAGGPDVSCVFGGAPARPITQAELWDTWYAPLFAFAASTPELRLIAYINSNWQRLAQFACEPEDRAGSAECPNGYWGSSRIQDAPLIQQRFAEQIRLLSMRGNP